MAANNAAPALGQLELNVYGQLIQLLTSKNLPHLLLSDQDLTQKVLLPDQGDLERHGWKGTDATVPLAEGSFGAAYFRIFLEGTAPVEMKRVDAVVKEYHNNGTFNPLLEGMGEAMMMVQVGGYKVDGPTMRLLGIHVNATGVKLVVKMGNLGTLVKAHRIETLSLEDVYNITSQLCDCLATMHRTQVVHRDIMASNVVLDQKDSGIEAKFIDHGVSQGPGSLKELPSPYDASLVHVITGNPSAAVPEMHPTSASGIIPYVQVSSDLPAFIQVILSHLFFRAQDPGHLGQRTLQTWFYQAAKCPASFAETEAFRKAGYSNPLGYFAGHQLEVLTLIFSALAVGLNVSPQHRGSAMQLRLVFRHLHAALKAKQKALFSTKNNDASFTVKKWVLRGYCTLLIGGCANILWTPLIQLMPSDLMDHIAEVYQNMYSSTDLAVWGKTPPDFGFVIGNEFEDYLLTPHQFSNMVRSIKLAQLTNQALMSVPTQPEVDRVGMAVHSLPLFTDICVYADLVVAMERNAECVSITDMVNRQLAVASMEFSDAIQGAFPSFTVEILIKVVLGVSHHSDASFYHEGNRQQLLDQLLLLLTCMMPRSPVAEKLLPWDPAIISNPACYAVGQYRLVAASTAIEYLLPIVAALVRNAAPNSELAVFGYMAWIVLQYQAKLCGFGLSAFKYSSTECAERKPVVQQVLMDKYNTLTPSVTSVLDLLQLVSLTFNAACIGKHWYDNAVSNLEFDDLVRQINAARPQSLIVMLHQRQQQQQHQEEQRQQRCNTILQGLQSLLAQQQMPAQALQGNGPAPQLVGPAPQPASAVPQPVGPAPEPVVPAHIPPVHPPALARQARAPLPVIGEEEKNPDAGSEGDQGDQAPSNSSDIIDLTMEDDSMVPSPAIAAPTSASAHGEDHAFIPAAGAGVVNSLGTTTLTAALQAVNITDHGDLEPQVGISNGPGTMNLDAEVENSRKRELEAGADGGSHRSPTRRAVRQRSTGPQVPVGAQAMQTGGVMPAALILNQGNQEGGASMFNNTGDMGPLHARFTMGQVQSTPGVRSSARRRSSIAPRRESTAGVTAAQNLFQRCHAGETFYPLVKSTESELYHPFLAIFGFRHDDPEAKEAKNFANKFMNNLLLFSKMLMEGVKAWNLWQLNDRRTGFEVLAEVQGYTHGGMFLSRTLKEDREIHNRLMTLSWEMDLGFIEVANVSSEIWPTLRAMYLEKAVSSAAPNSKAKEALLFAEVSRRLGMQPEELCRSQTALLAFIKQHKGQLPDDLGLDRTFEVRLRMRVPSENSPYAALPQEATWLTFEAHHTVDGTGKEVCTLTRVEQPGV